MAAACLTVGCGDAPEARAVVFISDRSGAEAIYAMDLEGSEIRRLTADSTSFPTVTRDGRTLAYADSRDGNIHILRLDGSRPEPLAGADSIYRARPAWSPDGLRLAFMGYPAGGKSWNIYVANADGGDQTLLFGDDLAQSNPSWSPDGRSVVFQSGPVDGASDLYLLDLADSEPIALTSHPATDAMASWSPDGSRLAFESTRDGDYEIYVMGANGENVVQLTDNDAMDGAPTWSPDGERILFHSDRDGNYEIYVMNADGSDQTRLTHDPAKDFRPVWAMELPGTTFSASSDHVGTESTETLGSTAGTGTLVLEVADWVPERAHGFGWWGAVPAGGDPSSVRDSTGHSDTLAIPAGTYDLYWKQDYDNPPLRLAAGLALQPGELATVEANTGVRLEVADWVPERAHGFGWWGAVPAGGDPQEERVQWSNRNDAILLPAGTYDLYWKQDYDNPPLRLAAGLTLQPGELATVRASTGIRLSIPANTAAPDRNWGFWGVIPPDGDPEEPLYLAREPARPLLLPPGTWDVVWKQDRSNPAYRIEERVLVPEGRLVEVRGRR